jgi:hypothetical protein
MSECPLCTATQKKADDIRRDYDRMWGALAREQRRAKRVQRELEKIVELMKRGIE